jgi:hypothetical protein
MRKTTPTGTTKRLSKKSVIDIVKAIASTITPTVMSIMAIIFRADTSIPLFLLINVYGNI